ncbi:hypothetical protein KY308_00475, partial [Candidatus Woesearchaeota archaeon]|nr:hypothetical protein [Candidatus Woesearchaeota archaeon]
FFKMKKEELTKPPAIYISREFSEIPSDKHEKTGKAVLYYVFEKDGGEFKHEPDIPEVAQALAELYSEGHREFYALPDPKRTNPWTCSSERPYVRFEKYPLLEDDIKKIEERAKVKLPLRGVIELKTEYPTISDASVIKEAS